MSDFEVVIGLEVHVQLKTASKVFCACATNFESPPNTNICPICCGYPGVLPVFNRKALELAIRVCSSLSCVINEEIYFERKNYFYPDLPKNYQISQLKKPLGENGFLELPAGKKIRINRVHLEEDAGKLIHKKDYSLADFNRTGIPLLEIVSSPEINSPAEAFDYLSSLKLILQYIGASDCDMEKGSLRCDANISLKEKGKKQLGTKVELKNMNTFKGVRDALAYEVKRQAGAIEKGERVIQETRLWDAQELRTVMMRSKEEAHDYRYFPEPDLLDFSVSADDITRQNFFVGELPLEKMRRFLKEHKLSSEEAGALISHKWLADFFEKTCKFFNHPKKVSNFILGPFLEQVYNLTGRFSAVKISPQNLAKVVKYFSEGKLNNLAAKKTLSLSIASNREIDEIIKEEGLTQISGENELSIFVEKAIADNPKPVEEYLGGKRQAIMFLVGQVMKKTRGKANPRVVRELLTRSLEGRKAGGK